MARAKCVRHGAYADWRSAIPGELREAMETPVSVAQLDWAHKRLVVQGLMTLARLEREVAAAEAAAAKRGKRKAAA